MLRVLILGGTTEASALVRALSGDPRYAATLSLAGVTRSPVLPEIAVRIGGFGGTDGLAEWLRVHAIAAVVDATHPFALRISRNAVAACDAAGVRRLRIERPEWRPVVGDRWSMVADMEAAAAAIGPVPRRVLLTIGTKDLAPFRDHPRHDYLIRSVDPPPASLLPPQCRLIGARGPFALDDELALLAGCGIETVVTKNSGGAATAPKLEAARRLGLPVVMVERPASAPSDSVPGWQEALDWLGRHQHPATPRVV